jgi:hypothetical protein
MTLRPTDGDGMRKALGALVVAGLFFALLGGRADGASRGESEARRDASHRLRTVPLPRRTHMVTHLPASLGLSGDPFAPRIPSHVDANSLFVTALASGQAFAWFQSTRRRKPGSSVGTPGA